MRRMKEWVDDYITQRKGWQRLGLVSEQLLGQELDRDEARLMAEWKPKFRKEE